MVTVAPRFSCGGVEAVVQGAAFAAVALWALTWSWWNPSSQLSLESRVTLWTCAGLSLLSTCLALVEIDLAVSDTVAASLASRPGRAFPLHFGLRGLEVCSRIWVWTVLGSLLSTEQIPIAKGGVPLLPVLLFIDYCLTACTFLGGNTRRWIWVLALGNMMANLMKFIDASAWSIRARKVTRRLAWLRHLEMLLALVAAGLWMVGLLPSSSPRHGPVRSWKDLQLFLSDGRNSLLVVGASSIVLYHLISMSLAQLHHAQVRADGLHRAAARGDAEALSRLLRDEGSQVSSCPGSARLLTTVNALNGDGWSPLHLAAAAPCAERTLRVLLRAQAQVSVTTPSGLTPLMLCAEAGADKALRLLLANGGSQVIQQSNSDGNTALHLAVREGHSECIHRLLRARADPSAANAQGLTAFDFTRAQKLTESLLSQSMSQSAFLEAMKDNRSELRKSLGGDSLGSDGAAFDNFQFSSAGMGVEPSRGPLTTPREVTPNATPRPSATSPTVTVRSNASVLDVPVMTAPESALEELLAEASRGGRMRLSNVLNPGASVLTEGTSRSSPSRSPRASGDATPMTTGGAVKITGLACMVAVASPGALRRLASLPCAPVARVSWSRGRRESGSCGSSDSEKDYSLNSFRIVAVIGEGSFGSVYEACDLRPGAGNRRCALKILHRRQYLAQDMLARAKQERQVLKAARHPFIVRLLCAFRTPGNEMALVMEYCCNGNLNDLLVRCGRPGLGEGLVRRLLAEVLLALAYLHDELDVVFRDMKPENIVLDANMHAKLTDFGLAKVDASAGGGACSFVGSMYFVAPEVTPAACRYSPAVDIYALGLVAWVCLTGGVRPETAQGSKDGPSQRLPPPTHEALRSWLDHWRPTVGTSTQKLSELAFSFIDVTTSSEPLQRQSASELRHHPFFSESRFSPRLKDVSDWAALLPSMEDEPTTPGSVATQDSWSWDARGRRSREPNF